MLALPPPLAKFFALFPLRTYPSILPPSKKPVSVPTLWIHPPHSQNSPLSADVECLKWQAYLALRGLTTVHLRTDIHPEGCIDGRLPNLLVPSTGENTSEDGQLLAAHLIPSWADTQKSPVEPDLEGYRDESARDESRAWVTLLEGTVHAVLVRVLRGASMSRLISRLSCFLSQGSPISKEYCRFPLPPRCPFFLRGLPMRSRVNLVPLPQVPLCKL